MESNGTWPSMFQVANCSPHPAHISATIMVGFVCANKSFCSSGSFPHYFSLYTMLTNIGPFLRDLPQKMMLCLMVFFCQIIWCWNMNVKHHLVERVRGLVCLGKDKTFLSQVLHSVLEAHHCITANVFNDKWKSTAFCTTVSIYNYVQYRVIMATSKNLH